MAPLFFCLLPVVLLHIAAGQNRGRFIVFTSSGLALYSKIKFKADEYCRKEYRRKKENFKMSYQNVRAYFEREGIADHITEHDSTADTVEHAARTVGCSPAEIAKSLSFSAGGKPIVIVAAGDSRINSSKFKSYFHQKPVMIPAEQVEILIGHAPGGVCPFAVKEGVEVYLDISLRRFSVIYTAAGKDTATVRLTIPELERYARAKGWVDVCKGWMSGENENPVLS